MGLTLTDRLLQVFGFFWPVSDSDSDLLQVFLRPLAYFSSLFWISDSQSDWIIPILCLTGSCLRINQLYAAPNGSHTKLNEHTNFQQLAKKEQTHQEVCAYIRMCGVCTACAGQVNKMFHEVYCLFHTVVINWLHIPYYSF